MNAYALYTFCQRSAANILWLSEKNLLFCVVALSKKHLNTATSRKRMKKELSELERKRLLKKHHHQKIDYALAKAFINDSDVYKLVKDFFAEYLNMDYEFTHEELYRELNKKFIDQELKKEITLFLSQLSHLQFNMEKHPSQETLKHMIGRFKQIIEHLVVFEEQKKKGFFSRIAGWFGRFFKKPEPVQEAPKPEPSSEPVAEETPEQEHAVKQGFEHLSRELESMQNPQVLVQRIERQIQQHDWEEARHTYKQLLAVYNQLSEQDKPSYFQKINQYYRVLQHY